MNAARQAQRCRSRGTRPATEQGRQRLHHKNVALRVKLPTPTEISFDEEQEVWAKQVTG